jgi:hypothetical protein
MATLTSVNVGMPKDVEWNQRTVIRAFARSADDDRPTIKSPCKPNHIVLQSIRRATEVDGIRVGGQRRRIAGIP